MITLKANMFALENLEFRPMRRLGMPTHNFGVTIPNSDKHTQGGRHVGVYDPTTNELWIDPEIWMNQFSPALKASLSKEDS